MTYVIEDGGRANLYAKEPPMEIMEVTETHTMKRLRSLMVVLAMTSFPVFG